MFVNQKIKTIMIKSFISVKKIHVTLANNIMREVYIFILHTREEKGLGRLSKGEVDRHDQVIIFI